MKFPSAVIVVPEVKGEPFKLTMDDTDEGSEMEIIGVMFWLEICPSVTPVMEMIGGVLSISKFIVVETEFPATSLAEATKT